MTSRKHTAGHRKALMAGSIGNFVEWYDSALYAFFASILASQFFSKGDPTAALLSTFAIFGAAFVVRPLGAAIFGYLGDRIGRRPVLLISVLMMSSATVAIGLLPTYSQVGVLAPLLLLLCRLMQGFAAGGEFTGASIFIIEHAPSGWRGRFASVGYVFVLLATAAGAVVSAVTTSLVPDGQLEAWGWRVPFILAAPLALIGLYLRLKVADSPEFTELREEGKLEKAPLKQAWKTAKKPMLTLIGWSMLPAVAGYTLSAFLPTYMAQSAGFSHTQSLLVIALAYVIAPVGCLFAGYAIDTYGRKLVAVVSALSIAVSVVPTFALARHDSLVVTFLSIGVFALIYGTIPPTMTLAVVELFPPRIRSSASAVSYNACFAIFGGTAPYLATWMVSHGLTLGPAFYIVALALIAAIVAVVGFGNGSENNSPTPASEASPARAG